MKKLFFIAVIAIVAITANAQKGEYFVTPHINVGYAGLSNMQLREGGFGEEYADNMLVGVGADVEYMLADRFGVSAGLDFNYIESKKSKWGGLYFIEDYYSYSKMNIPILAQYHVGRFAVKTGLQPGIFLAAVRHVHGRHDGLGNYYSYTNSAKGYFYTFNLSAPVGVSYTFGIPVTIDLRCNLPLTKAVTESNVTSLQHTRLTTVVLSAGYRF